MTPGWILITHRHRDHLAGVDVLRQRFGCRVMGPAEVTEVALDRVVTGGERLELGDVVLDVMATPGHTEGHLAYVSSGLVGPSLFSGDALFLAGCGRVAAGQASDMWGSLNRLRVLAGSTVVYPGHDYLADNLQFSLSLEPGNAEVQRALAGGFGAEISTMRVQRRVNPFLRADDPVLRSALGIATGVPDGDAFAEIRRRKDRWG